MVRCIINGMVSTCTDIRVGSELVEEACESGVEAAYEVLGMTR